DFFAIDRLDRFGELLEGGLYLGWDGMCHVGRGRHSVKTHRGATICRRDVALRLIPCSGESPLDRPLLLAALLLASGCARISPRFGPDIAASFAREPMRKLETDSVELYYPASEREAALRTLER